MAEQENCVQATRSSKRRATPAVALPPQQLPSVKRRVVLGELTNSPDIALAAQSSDQSLKKRDHGSLKKTMKVEEEGDREALYETEIVGTSSGDPQSSSIYQHLHSLEVLVFYAERVFDFLV